MVKQMTINDFIADIPKPPRHNVAVSRTTRETRRESNESTNKARLYTEILTVLTGTSRALTAREVAAVLYSKKVVAYPLRQAVQPRLTELCEYGKVKVAGKVYDEETRRNVATYKAV